MPSWLLDGEQVALRSRPHPRILITPVGVGLLLITATSAALAKLQHSEFVQWAPGAAPFREPLIVLLVTTVLLLECAYPVRRVLRWARTRYLLTNQRLIIRRGQLRRHDEIIALYGVQGIERRQTWRQRLVGAGDLELHLATGGVRRVRDVPYIDEFQNYTQEAWMTLFRASYQAAPAPGYYAGDVDVNATTLIGREQRQLGRDQ